MSSNEAAAKAAAEAASNGKADAVMVPGSEGKPDMGSATGATKMSGGGLILTPLPLNGGKKGKKTRKVSKKVLKMLKKMGSAKVAKLLKKKGGQEETVEEEPMTAGRRKTRRGGRRHSRKLY